MRARALMSAITFGLLFVLLLVVQAPPIAGSGLAVGDGGEMIAGAVLAHAGYDPADNSLGAASLETWSNFQPSGWVGAAPVTCTVEVFNLAGFQEQAEYQYAVGGTWSAWVTDGLQRTWLDATRRRVTVSNLAFPNSLTEDQNQIRFRYKASSGGWLQSDLYLVRVDTIAPSSTVTLSPCYASAMQIQGTASDSGSGVAAVAITLQRASDGQYYNGSSWEGTARWITTSGTTNWSLPFAPTVETTYSVTSRATDNVGRLQSSYGTGAFLYDASPPTSVVLTTGYFGLGTWPGVIQGSASDSASGVAAVHITIQRASDRLYYDGASWGSTPNWLAVNGTSSWTMSFAPAVQTAYTVTSQATNNCGSSQVTPSVGTFTYDTTPPTSVVASTGCSNVFGGRIEGAASDTLSGVAVVRVALQRASDGFYYSGSSWGPTTTWITASGTTAWSVPFVPTVETAYTVTSQATDRSGNVQSVPGTGLFTHDVTPPQSTITATSCLDSWPGAIRGAANDAVSGVAYVQLKLQRSSDGLYYNGAFWGADVTWINAVGTTSWSLPFMPTVQALYTVTASAIDNCGNVQANLSMLTFAYDRDPPSSTIGTSGYYSSSLGSIVGTAHDEVSGVAQVDVRLQRAADGLYYDGASWTASSVWISAVLTPAPAVAGQSSAASPSLERDAITEAGWDISILTAAGWNVGWALPFVPAVQTAYTVESRAADYCGRVQAVPTLATFVYDVVAPSAPINLAVQPSLWTPVNSFTVTWTNPPDSSGIAAAHYKWDSAPTSNNDESPGSPVVSDGIQSLPGLAVPLEGTHQLFVWLGDKAGKTNFQNYGATAAAAFKWDARPPATSVISLTSKQGCSGWVVSAVTVTLQSLDVNPNPAVAATSGVSATFWRTNANEWQPVVASSFAVVDQGAHAIEYYSVDVAGNAETPHPITPTIKIDTVPPTTSPPNFTGTLGPNGWYRSAVSVTLAAVDATSGVSVTYHQVNTGPVEPGNSFSIAADGVYSIRYYSVDAACNQENPYTATLKIDKTYPNTVHQLDGRLGENGWFVASPVTVTLSASDVITGIQGSSGVDKLYYRIDSGSWQVRGATASFTVTVPAGQKEYMRTLEYYATDLAGNAEPVYTLTVGIDSQAPSALPVRPYAIPGGWTNVNCFDVRWIENPPDYSGIGGAYYSFHLPISPTDGISVSGDNLLTIPCVQVPDELGDGLRIVHVWLRDRAGNSNHLTSNSVTIALDRAPPQVEPVVAGISCGTAGWYNSAITVTCAATDTLSGMASGVISYQVNSGGWIQGASYSESLDGRYVVECRATDTAGNTSYIASKLVRLDRTAPQAPTPAWVEPSDWSGDPVFTVGWVNPADLSGLGGVYYKQGSPPSSPTDGTYVDGLQTSLSITVTTEGLVPAYIWLVDKACNSDYQQRVTVTLRYDHTPPTTTFSAVGTLGNNGWYTSPVSITLKCEDSGSGCGTGSGHYRIGDGPWQDGDSFLLTADGTLIFSYYSLDVAGNAGSAQTGTVKLDRTPPSSYAYSDGYSPSPSFLVQWDGSDAIAGIEAFDVQYRVGTGGAWTDWVLNTTQKSRLFTGASGKAFYFRARARDKAGNVEPYPAVADTYVSVDLLVNGNFETNLGGEWATKGVCPVTQTYAPSYTGGSTRVVVLGCPDAVDADFGESMVCQTITVPGTQDMTAPALQFRYHIYTYDVLWGELTQRYYDSFSAGVSDPGQMSPTYVFTDGNRSQVYDALMDLGWRQGSMDLRPYAGRTVRVCLANVTRVDKTYNTWTLVDDVRIVDLEHRITLPLVQRMRIAQVSSAGSPEELKPNSKGDR
jgi:hypothetical protein